MIVFVSLSNVIFAIFIGILAICGFLYSMTDVYAWCMEHIGVLLLCFVTKSIVQPVLTYFAIEKKDGLNIVATAISALSNILFIPVFWIYINRLANLQIPHPIITVFCTIFGFLSIVIPYFFSIFAVADIEMGCVLGGWSIIVSILLLISCFTSLGWMVFLHMVIMLIDGIGMVCVTEGD